MTAFPQEAGYAPVRSARPLAGLQNAALFLFLSVSGFALIEPSPYELMFCVVLPLFLVTGVKVTRPILVLAFLLLLYNFGGFFSLIPFMDEPLSIRFVAVSFYLMFTALLFAVLMQEHTAERLRIIHQGYLVAAWLSGIAGILGYFDIAGMAQFLTLNGRASGTFKDPNVLGPFLVLPIAHLTMRMLTGQVGALKGLLLISMPVLALFLSFSRGAWGLMVFTLIVMFGLLFVTAQGSAQRVRIVLFCLAGLGVAMVALGIVLSFEEIRLMFEERASLNQSYDMGVQGRFGNQLRSLPLLLDAPNGLGPLRFRFHFPEDPHNVYINAFASYGWLGGFVYIGLTVATCIVGFRLVRRRSPLQNEVIVIWATLFVGILQGFQIDTDHWRHFYLLLGLTWGLSTAVRAQAPAHR